MTKLEELTKQGYKLYENEDIYVFWNPNKCFHAGECVRGNSLVFDVNRRPWVDLSMGSAMNIASVIDKCPSHALQYEFKIKISLDEECDRAVAISGTKEIGECYFNNYEDSLVITHTFVNEDYKGRGIAKKLVEKVIEKAIKENKKIDPLCSYAKKVMMDNPEYEKLMVKK